MPAFSPTTSRRTAISRCLGLTLAAFSAAALTASPATAAPAGYAGTASDGHIAFFTTTDKLVPGDTDSRADVYARFYDSALDRHVTRAVSTGPTGGNDAFTTQYDGASADGAKAFFSTSESLVSADTDQSEDVYVRDIVASTTTLASQGDPACAARGCGNGDADSSFVPRGVVPDGSMVFFTTSEQLTASDTDASADIYVRDDKGTASAADDTTALVSAGGASCAGSGCGNGPLSAFFQEASASGDRAFYTTSESLDFGDVDSLLDIYERDLDTGTTSLVSTPDTCPPSLDCSAVYGDASSDGSHVFFETNERLAPQDTDDSQDVYGVSAGVASLASIGPDGGNGGSIATFSGASAGGSTVFFETGESLTSADTDSSQDVYQRSGGVTTLLSTGPDGGNGAHPASFRWASPDGSSTAAIFSTAESLIAADTDSSQDVYQRSGGVTTLLSTGADGGDGEFDASFAGASSDGSHVFLITPEQLISQDTDSSPDIYEVAGGTTTLVSIGPVGGRGAFTVGLPAGGVAGDGSHAFFVTEERLTVDDLDAETDVYDRSASGTLLVSVTNLAPVGPPTPSGLTTDPASPGVSTTPAIRGQSDPNTSIKIYATSDCSGVPVATGTSVDLGETGIVVTVAAGSTTSFRATATDTNGDTSPCSAAVSYTQQSTPPPPPPPDPGGGGTGGGGTSSGSGSGGTSTGGSTAGGRTFLTPRTRITFAPSTKTRARRPVFRFTDETGQEGTTFHCKVDRRPWQSCSSPVKLKRLRWGKHTFRVTGMNAAGGQEPGVAKQAFKVVRG